MELTAIPWYLMAAKYADRPVQGMLLQFVLSLASIFAITELLMRRKELGRKLRGGKGTDRKELTDFLAALYQGYTDFYQGQVPTAAQRMREVWFYLIHLFDDAEKLNKQLRRFRTPSEYERIQAEILASCPIRSNVQGDLI